MKKYIFNLILLVFTINMAWASPNDNSYRASDIKKAIQALSKNSNLLINNLDLSKPIALPKGISKESGSQKVVVGIDSMKLNSGGASFKAISYFELPGFGEEYGLSFENNNIEVHPDGFKSGTEVRLNLVNDVIIPFGQYSKIRFSASKDNFVMMDCGGFKNVNLEGEVIFDKNFLVSVKSNEEIIVSFKIQTASLNDYIVKLDMPSFKLLQTGDLIVNPKQFYLDLSDNTNVSVFAEPTNYINPYAGSPMLWRGFFIIDGTVEVPGSIVTSKTDNPLSIPFKNFLIDKNGFTGAFGGIKVIELADGINEGWPISIDDINITIVKNKIQKGKINGLLQIPISRKNVFKYTGNITQPGQSWAYDLSLASITKVYIDIFDATAELDPTSIIKFERAQDGRYLPYANLNGTMFSNNKLFRAKDIAFENLELVAEYPYLKDEVKFNWENTKLFINGFSAEIEDMGIEFDKGRPTLGLSTRASFIQLGKNTFDAAVGLNFLYDLKAIKNEKGNVIKHDWTLEKIRPSKIEFETTLSVIEMKGSFEFYDEDKEFGTGGRGAVEIIIPKFTEVPFKAELIIGTKDDFKYMKVFAHVPLPKPMPLFSPSFQANAIIFGFYKHMRIEYAKQIEKNTNFTEVNYAETRYVPDNTVDFGVQIGLGFQIPKMETASGFGIVEFTFNKGGGLRNIVLTGEVEFLKTKEGVKGEDKFAGSMVAIYDLPNKTLHAEIVPILNLKGKIMGKEREGKLGPVLIHADPKRWFVWAGRPSKKLAIVLKEKGFDLITLNGYFQMGSEVDPFPDPPSELASIIGTSKGEIGMRDDKDLKSGGAILFGGSMQGLNLDGDYSIFYYKLKSEMGFDVMMKKYASNVTCKGGNGSPVGWNGWFAKGQVYAYVTAAVGIRVKNDRYAIMDAGLGALLQATLPNPIWAKGTLGGRYSVLGGMIKGKFTIPFEFGEKCELMNKASITDIPLISDIIPSQNDKNVDVFTTPQVAFNMSIGEEFSLEDDNGTKRIFRIALKDFMNLTLDGKDIKGTYKWNDDKTIVSFESDEILPPQTSLQTFASAAWEEKKGNIWVRMKNIRGSEDKQDTLVNYTTGNAPEDIPMSNVRFAYPIHNQFNFHKGEGDKGYITLKRGQAYLFEKNDKKPFDLKATLYARNKPPLDIDYTYITTDKEVSFDIPQGIANETVYNIVFNLRPKPTSGNSTPVKKDVAVNVGGNTVVEMTQNKLAGPATKNIDIFIHSIDFRTSKYNTFSEKIASMGSLKSAFDVTTQNLTILGGIFNNAPETFETFELKGNGPEVARLIDVEATPNNSWYNNRIAPLIYNEMTNNGNLTITNRNINEYGERPLKAIRIFSKNQLNGYSLTKTEAKSGNAAPKSGPVLFTYDLSWICYNDFFDLRNQAVNKFLNTGSNIPRGAMKLISGEYSDLIRGDYNFKLTYKLPGKNIPGSVANLAINY
jgi:hypothetical protein